MTSGPENIAARGKVFPSALAALEGVADGASVLVAGSAGCGIPENLIRGLAETGVGELTLICQGAWPQKPGTFGVDDLVTSGRIKKMISPMPFYPKTGGSEKGGPIMKLWEAGRLELEIVPMGVLAERLRAGGAGIGGVFLPTGVGARFAEGKEIRRFDGRDYVLEVALKADLALLRAQAADTLGNLVYEGTGRNWNPTMAMAAGLTVVEVDRVDEPGGLDPELVITQAIFIDRIVLNNAQ